MARRKKSDAIATIDAFSRLPWHICLILAVASFLGFHWLSGMKPPPASDIAHLANTLWVSTFKTAGMILQYIAPLVLIFAAIQSWTGQRRRGRLLIEAEQRTESAPLQQISWREFEQLVGAYFERQGYSISFTPDGADGGVDIVARKGKETFLIQCKQWRATQVGVSVVRELFGVMTARGATGSFVVSIGPFTDDAKAFASGRNITLVNANTLLNSKPVARNVGTITPDRTTHPDPVCPKCGSPMIRRVAKQGANAGNTFFGCSTFPKCRGVLPAS